MPRPSLKVRAVRVGLRQASSRQAETATTTPSASPTPFENAAPRLSARGLCPRTQRGRRDVVVARPADSRFCARCFNCGHRRGALLAASACFRLSWGCSLHHCCCFCCLPSPFPTLAYQSAHGVVSSPEALLPPSHLTAPPLPPPASSPALQHPKPRSSRFTNAFHQHSHQVRVSPLAASRRSCAL